MGAADAARAPGIEEAAGAAVTLLRRVRGRAAAAARSELRALAERLAPVQVDLLPERNHYTGQLEHGVLIRAAGETAYVTCRGVEATPWLFHHVHDFRETTFLTVDAQTLSLGETVAALDELLEHTELCERLVDSCIIQRELARRDDAVAGDELQKEVDAMRRRRGLLTAADTERWLRARGISHQRLEQMAATAVRTRRLRHELCAADVEAHFAAHGDALDRAALVRLRFANGEQARGARARLSSRASFFEIGRASCRERV